MFTVNEQDAKVHQLDRLMRSMNVGWALYWCEAEVCACLGCANGSGKLNANGYTKQDWKDWWSKHGKLVNE